MVIVAIVILIIGIVTVETAYRLLIKKESIKKIDSVTVKAAIIEAIIIPIFFFGYVVPNKYILGLHNEYTKVESESGKQYNVMVTFYLDGETYCPKEINWSNGGQSHIEDAWDYEEIGEWSSGYDQAEQYYKILIPEFTFNYVDQFNAVSFLDKAIYLVSFISSLVIIYYKLNDKENEETI